MPPPVLPYGAACGLGRARLRLYGYALDYISGGHVNLALDAAWRQIEAQAFGSGCQSIGQFRNTGCARLNIGYSPAFRTMRSS
jgi:hypothetical protein